MAIGRGRDRAERDAGRLDDGGAFEALFAPIHRTAAGHLATTRRLRDTAIDSHITQVQADDPIIGSHHQGGSGVPDTRVDPLVPATPQGGRRTGGIGDAVVSAAEHEHLDELVEHNSVRHARAVTPARMANVTDRQQRGKLVPNRFNGACFDGGYGDAPSHGELEDLPV
jgi:hypothetical protein